MSNDAGSPDDQPNDGRMPPPTPPQSADGAAGGEPRTELTAAEVSAATSARMPPPSISGAPSSPDVTAAMPMQPGDPFAAPAAGAVPLHAPTVTLSPDTGHNDSFFTRKVAKLPIVGWIAIALVAVVGVVVAIAVVGGDDEDKLAIDIVIPTTNQAPPTSPTTLAPSTTVDIVPVTTAPTTATTAVPATSAPAEGDGSSEDSAILLGDPSTSQFVYQSPYSDAAWAGSVVAISEATAYDPDDGQCLVVFATLTPTAVTGLVSYGYDAPPMSLIVDGEELEQAYGSCDSEDIESAGWGSFFEASGTVGTEFPVHNQFQVPDSTDLDNLLLVVGDEETGRTYFRGGVSGTPQPEPKPGAPLGVSLTAAGDGAVYEYEDPFSSSKWNFTFDGLVEQQADSFNDVPGVCLAAVGTASPLNVNGVVSSGFDAPRIGVVADGRYLEGGFGDCEDTDGALVGRVDLFDAAVTVGTQMQYYSEVFVPERFAGSIEAVLVGDSGFGGPVYPFSPTVVSPPAVVPTPGNPVGGDQLPVGTLVSTGDDGLGNEWDIVVRGLIELPPTEEGRCFAVIGIGTPTASDEPTAAGYTVPTMSIVIDGRQIRETFSSCDLSAVESAGYVDYFDVDVPIGTPYAFSVSFVVPPSITAAPEVILVGDGAFAVPPLVVATILPEIPPV